MATQKMKHCAWCGEELGMAPGYDREPESCGKPECNREVRGMYQAQRDEAHEELDRQNGWGDWAGHC